MRRLPPLSAIEAFVAVARERSIKAAAEALALSSPAISRRIQSLERHVGHPLFDRQAKRMVLNARGEALNASLTPVLAALTDVLATAMAIEGLARVRLGIPPLFATQRFFPVLPQLRQQHPEIHLDIDTQPHATSRLGDSLDIAIIIVERPDPSLYAHRLDHNALLAIATRTYLEREAIVSPGDLVRATILQHRELPGSFEAWADQLGFPGIQPAAIDLYDSGQLLLDAAASGLGIALMHENHLTAARDSRLISVFNHSVKSDFSYWLVCRPRALEQPAVRKFRDWIIAALANG